MLKSQAGIANTIAIFMNVNKDCKDNNYKKKHSKLLLKGNEEGFRSCNFFLFKQIVARLIKSFIIKSVG